MDTEAEAKTEPPQAHTSALRRPRLSAPRYPVFILFTMTKAIYLFHLERKPGFISLSPECSVALLPPAPPWDVCASPVPLVGLWLWCVLTWAQGCPCVGPRTYSFQGVLLWVPEHTQHESLGGPVRKGCGAPRVSRQETDIFARGFLSLVFWGGAGGGLCLLLLSRLRPPMCTLRSSGFPEPELRREGDEWVSSPREARGARRGGETRVRSCPSEASAGLHFVPPSGLCAQGEQPQLIPTPQSHTRSRAGWGGAASRRGPLAPCHSSPT